VIHDILYHCDDCRLAEHVKKMEDAESEKRQAAASAAADKADAQTGISVLSVFLILSADN